MIVRKKNVADILKVVAIPLVFCIFIINPIELLSYYMNLDNSGNLYNIIIKTVILIIVLLASFVYYQKRIRVDLYYTLTLGVRGSGKLVKGEEIGLPNKFADLTAEQDTLFLHKEYVELSILIEYNKENLNRKSTKEKINSSINKNDPYGVKPDIIESDDPFADFYKK